MQHEDVTSIPLVTSARTGTHDVTAERSPEDNGTLRSSSAGAAAARDPLLRIRGVTVRFGAIAALSDVSFEVRRGEILGLIGPNGAGKTTLFNCLSRLCELERGTIRARRTIAARGAASCDRADWDHGTFQHLALFETMSVLDNVLVGTHVRGRGGFFADALRDTEPGGG